ncbi:MAG: LysR family transcriptional regulator [Novosphingobium sp.]|nr:LysR family transcriptional regulator [Novosphingobium sp.]
MTKPNRSRSPRHSNAQYRWSRDKLLAFLRALAEWGSVAAAAREVGMSRQSAYRLRARMGEELGEVWDEGLRLGKIRRKVTHLVQSDSSCAR